MMLLIVLDDSNDASSDFNVFKIRRSPVTRTNLFAMASHGRNVHTSKLPSADFMLRRVLPERAMLESECNQSVSNKSEMESLY